MDTDSFIINKRFYDDIADDVDERLDTSNYECDRSLSTGKNKDELGGKILTEFVALRAKAYSYLMNDNIEVKKAKGTKKCILKRMLKFLDYKDCLLCDEIILKSQRRYKSEAHNVYTEKINKIALSSNNDKKLQTDEGITTYPYGYKHWKSMQNKDTK